MNKKFLKNVYYVVYAICFLFCLVYLFNAIFDYFAPNFFDFYKLKERESILIDFAKSYDTAIIIGVSIFVVFTIFSYLHNNPFSDTLYLLCTLGYIGILIYYICLGMDTAYEHFEIEEYAVMSKVLAQSLMLITSILLVASYRGYRLFACIFPHTDNQNLKTNKTKNAKTNTITINSNTYKSSDMNINKSEYSNNVNIDKTNTSQNVLLKNNLKNKNENSD